MQDKILIVDDDQLVLACFERLLARQFNIETATGPYAALEAIQRSGPYAVVVSDLRMPGMNGVQLLEKARQLSPDIVGLVLSGNASASEVESCSVYKMLDKPCPITDLIAALVEAIAHHHRMRQRN
jgi:DNA-binding NtrC family response regulator